MRTDEPESWLKHLPVVLGLIALQLAARPIESVVYRLSIRPALIRWGALPCESPPGNEAVPNCDLVLEHRHGDEVERTYYAADGSTKVRRVMVGDAVVTSETFYWSNTARLLLPFVGVGIAFIATVRKILRTGSFFTWQLARHPWDRREKLLLLYSMPIILTGLIQLAAVR